MFECIFLLLSHECLPGPLGDITISITIFLYNNLLFGGIYVLNPRFWVFKLKPCDWLFGRSFPNNVLMRGKKQSVCLQLELSDSVIMGLSQRRLNNLIITHMSTEPHKPALPIPFPWWSVNSKATTQNNLIVLNV